MKFDTIADDQRYHKSFLVADNSIFVGEYRRLITTMLTCWCEAAAQSQALSSTGLGSGGAFSPILFLLNHVRIQNYRL